MIAGYRALTGRASMLPDWAFGFWQSKNKYNTQDEVLDTVAEFRRRGIPLDVIVQDWQYWPIDRWGDHEFEASRYPDPTAMIRTIHDQHARFMISVWGKFYPATENFKAMRAIDALYPATIDGADPRLAAARVRLLRRVQRAGEEAVLGSGEPRALQPRRRRLVDGRDGAGSRAAFAADARIAAARHRPDGDGDGVARDECLSADEQPGGLRRPAIGGAGSSACSFSPAPGSPASSATPP